jgi:hypothetical protein
VLARVAKQARAACGLFISAPARPTALPSHAHPSISLGERIVLAASTVAALATLCFVVGLAIIALG